MRLRGELIVVACLIALGGCITRAPAPVVDRRPPPAKPAAPPVASAPAAAPDTYVVKRGDTLYSIALEQGVDWHELAALNQLSDPTKLSTGQVLRLRAPQPAAAPAPEDTGVVVSPITATAPIAARPLGADGAGATGPLPSGPPSVSPPIVSPPIVSPSTVPPAAAPPAGLKTEPKGIRLPYSDQNLAVLQRSEPAPIAPPLKPEPPPPAPKSEAPPPPAQPEAPPAAKSEPQTAEDRVDWAWPAAGKVVATFDGAASKGLDIAGRIGDPVYASAPGRVVYSGEGIPAYGKLVIIRHNSTYLSAYAHNSQILVKEGQSVAKGQKIAELGSTGATQAKLHFEIRRLGKPVDPMQYLPNRAN